MKLVALAFLLGACGGSPPPPQPSPDPDPTTEDDSWKAECEACLASGQSWTADRCAESCLMDTWCYGPGNEAAASCPDERPTDRTDW